MFVLWVELRVDCCCSNRNKSICTYMLLLTQLNNGFSVMHVHALKIPSQSFSCQQCKIKTYMLLWTDEVLPSQTIFQSSASLTVCIVFLQVLICYYGKSIVYNWTLSAKCGLIISGSAIVDSSLTVNCSLLLPDINCRHKLVFETYYFVNESIIYRSCCYFHRLLCLWRYVFYIWLCMFAYLLHICISA